MIQSALIGSDSFDFTAIADSQLLLEEKGCQKPNRLFIVPKSALPNI